MADTADTTILSINLITSNPKVRNGRPCIRGTGLRVIDIVSATLFHHRTPTEIAADYDIPLASVHAAFAYYYEHKEELDADIREQTRLVKEMKEKRIGTRHPPLLPR